MKKVLFCLALVFIFFGCTIFSGSARYEDFFELKEKYFVTENFVPNTSVMDSYISEISLLRANASGDLARILDFEIGCAQAFVYFTRALEESSKINYFSNHCTKIEYKNTISYLNLAISHSEIAKNVVLSNADLVSIRHDQQEVVRGINISSKELLNSIKETC